MSTSSRFHGPQDRLLLAQSPAATAGQFRELARSPHGFVRAAVAGNPNTPPDVLDSLVPSSIDSNSDVEIAMAIVRNPATDRRTHARGPLLRRFAEDLIVACGDGLLACLDDAETARDGKSRLRFGATELVIDVSAGCAYLVDTTDEQGEAKIALEVFRSWVSNVDAVTARLRDRIRADFGDGSFNEVLWALGWLPSFRWAPTERLPAAAVLFARGDWHRLMDFVREANIDMRDALILGGLQHQDWSEHLDIELA